MARLLIPGTVLRGRYEITGLIGQGGMGAVYLALDLRLEGRKTAIKEITLESYGTPDDPITKQAREQFHREASILARLDHPNLPKVSDFFNLEGRDYLVMDFVPGRDLREILAEARASGKLLPESDVLDWAQQIGEALSYLHHQSPPLLHRDIKPGNVKLTPAGQIKLVDFGLVKIMVSDDERTITVLQGRGTVAYTPIEQYGGDTGGHTDSRSDIYSFAATLYHLLSGELPLDAKERFLHPNALLPLRELNPALSTEIEQGLLWALEIHPSERPTTVELFLQALQQGVSREGGVIQPNPSWQTILLQNKRLSQLVILLIFLSLLLTWQLS